MFGLGLDKVRFAISPSDGEPLLYAPREPHPVVTGVVFGECFADGYAANGNVTPATRTRLMRKLSYRRHTAL